MGYQDRQNFFHNLTFCVWNVGGLISKYHNKITDPLFLQEIKSHDVVLLTETHVGYNTTINIDGFHYYPVCRQQSANSRYYGGLGILIKHGIRKGIKILGNTSKDYQWLKFEKSYFNLKTDIFLCLAYIIPATSFYVDQSEDDILENIEKDIISYSRQGSIVLCGDLNARTGSEPDFILNDTNDIHLPMYDNYNSDIIQEKRYSYDTKVDSRGKQLLDLCIASKLRILNGRTWGDLNGKYTCIKPMGNSIVDYVIMSENLLEDILFFHVHDFLSTLSDCHCKLTFGLLARYTINEKEDETNVLFPGKYVWSENCTQIFQDTLCQPDIKRNITNFLDTKFDLSEDFIETAVTECSNIIDNAASKCLKFRKTKNKQTHKHKHKKWYDCDLVQKRRILISKGELLSKFPRDPIVKGSYYKCYREYNKLRKYKQRNFKQKILQSLDTLREDNPKSYWNLIKELKDDKSDGPEHCIDSNTWFTYFQALNLNSDKYKDRLFEINKKVEDLEKSSTFCELDYKITIKEVHDVIRKLKNNKAVGIDGIPSELFKSGSSVLAPVLCKLFNLILCSGYYPRKWSLSYLCPIFKSGNPNKPENYRGIAINSCIGKIFNSILNKRFDSYLEKNNIIHPHQIGFSKKCRTSDHIFVLKTILDKYINKKGGKVYACFVDFKKAFDRVVHSGIKYKLLKNHISGKFYNILKDMYRKNEMCVKIGNILTPSFMSLVGVRQGDVLSPSLFKLFINDLPLYLASCQDPVDINNHRVDCLMYADDIVLLSNSKEGLQTRLDKLHCYCTDWCLDVNLSKTKILIFNKPGKFLKEILRFNNENVECVNTCKYLGVIFSSSGLFHHGKEELYRKSLKANFKLRKSMLSCNPSIKTSIHLYDHTIKPILMYCSEILGMFKTNSAACKKKSDYLFELIYINDYLDKSHFRYLKYILGVNKKATNLAVLSEVARFPLYFSIILSMIKYAHRLEKMGDGLLYDAYVCNKLLDNESINCWYSSVRYILETLKINNLNISLSKLIQLVKCKLCESFKLFWKNKRTEILSQGNSKLENYFNLKKDFTHEPYLSVKDFHVRKAICKMRISAHDLRIEKDRYSKTYIERSQRLCRFCLSNASNAVEDEEHFIVSCPLYNKQRRLFFDKIDIFCKNFKNLPKESKFFWLFTNEHLPTLIHFGNFIIECSEIRNRWRPNE